MKRGTATVGAVRGFAPIAGANARILILGTMPSGESLRVGHYYAHPRNAFWRIMADLADAGPDKPYEDRTRILKAGGIAVWDVLQSCERPGSLDANISNEVPNDFGAFFAVHKNIALIGLNGGKAEECFLEYAARHCPAHVKATRLPSTSAAYSAMSLMDKSRAWRAGLNL